MISFISEFLEEISDLNPEAKIVDGFDDAIIGITHRIGMDNLVAYDMEKIIQILMKRDKMSYEEAIDYFDFNIIGSWVGEGTPMFIDTKKNDTEWKVTKIEDLNK